MEIKIFLYDFFTKRKIIYAFIMLVIFSALISIFSSELNGIKLKNNYIDMVGIMIAFTSTSYIIYTYSVLKKIKSYLMLPIVGKKLILQFVLALFLGTLVNRASFMMVFIVQTQAHPLRSLLLLLLNAFISVAINIGILIALNSKSRKLLAFNILMLAATVFNSMINSITMIKISILLIGIILELVLVTRARSLDLGIVRQQKLLSAAIFKKNYFFNVIRYEKISIVNTLCLLLVIFVVGVVGSKNILFNILIWSVGAINTPLLTMISGDKDLMRQVDMLPNRKTSIYGMYYKFLAAYFVLINFIIFIIMTVSKNGFSLSICLHLIFTTLLELTLAGALEKKCRIEGWKTKHELWKNPRKYVMPIIVFAINILIDQLNIF